MANANPARIGKIPGAAETPAPAPKTEEGLDSGPRIGSKGEYLPAKYRIRPDSVREDR